MLRWTDDELADYKAKRKQAVEDGKAYQRSLRPKYGNRRTRVGIRVFASRAEARRYLELDALQKAGAIKDLKCQVSFPIVVAGELVCRYVSDFTYLDGTGKMVVEDVKGMPTPIYKLKKKLMRAVLGIDVVEVRKAGKAEGGHV